jgi:hypothetical protein
MKPVRTATLGMIVFVTIALAGCSSSSSGVAAPATAAATLSAAPTAPTSSAPASSAIPVAPVSSLGGPGEVTPTATPPSVAPHPSVAPISATPPVPGLSVAEWADSTGPPPPPAAHAVTAFGAVACPAPEVGAAGSTTRLPAAVQIKAVVRCETVQRSYPGIGSWTVQLAEVADTNLGPFLADLRALSQTRRTDVICPDLVILVPWFGVVDDAGNVMRPLLPTDACGKPQTAVIAALQALQFRVTQAVRIAHSG